MLYSTETLALAAEALDSDGATYELPDGAILRLRIEPDYDTSIADHEDRYGRIAPPLNRWGSNVRLSDFDGNAEKIDTREGRVWWQPPADVKRTDEHFAALRRNVLDALEMGWVGYVVELCEGRDAYDRPIIRGVASCWGIEAAKMVPEIVADLVSEACYDSTPDLGAA